MAKILVCISNSIKDDGKWKIACFYEQFIIGLKNCGNDVLIYNPSEFNIYNFGGKNKLRKDVREVPLRKEIINFNPDLVITFNYATYHDLLSITNCPIVIWNADFSFMWNQLSHIKKNIGRYTFFSFSENGINDIKSGLSNVKDSQIHIVKAGTILKRENIEQDKNISFIGSNFGVPNKVIEFIKDNQTPEKTKYLRKILNYLTGKGGIPPEMIYSYKDYKGRGLDFILGGFPLSGLKRVNVLNSVVDLDLYLYGIKPEWVKIARVLPYLFASFVDTPVYSMQHNQDIYNSSKLCLNVMHGQSKDGMPWRILDIMATQGCLVSESSQAIEKMYEGKIKLPVFTNQFEARELCIKLLKDNVLRNEIVEASNEIIKERGHWNHKFKQISDIMGINIFRQDVEGSVTYLHPVRKFALPSYRNIKNNIRYKLWEHFNEVCTRKNLIE